MTNPNVDTQELQARVVVSAGELSGDEHLSRLVAELRFHLPFMTVKGMGGKNLASQGVELIVNSEKSGNVMGFVEIVSKIPALRKAFKEMVSLLDTFHPELLILCDFPDFNLRLAKEAKKRGIKVLYFIPPKVWVWRSQRTELLKRYVDVVSCIFPFESSFLQKRGVDRSYFVGHPFTDMHEFDRLSAVQRAEFRSALGFEEDDFIILFMPGSRSFEVKRHAKTVFDALTQLQLLKPNMKCVVCRAPTISKEKLLEVIPARFWISISDLPAPKLMQIADMGLIKSGTSTLQAVFADLPFACIYKAPWIAERIVRSFASLQAISLPNLVLPGTVAELIQKRFNPTAIKEEVLRLMKKEERNPLRRKMREVIHALSGCDKEVDYPSAITAYSRTAKLCIELMHTGSQ